MKILLINPIYPDRPQTVYFPLGLAYVASSLIKNGHRVDVLDINGLQLSEKETLAELTKRDFDLAGTGGIVTAYGHIKWLLASLKAIKPHIPLVIGGGLASAMPDLVLEKTAADIAVLGEGEVTMPELAKAIENRIPLSGIRGIYYKNGSGITRNPLRKAISDLEALPFPAWDLFPIERYICNMEEYSYVPSRTMRVLANRSCPFRCSFCYHPLGQVVRMRSPRNIVEEIRILVSKYGVKYIRFVDELFTINKKNTEEFCFILEKENLDIKWQCSGRVNNADRELYRRMKKVGCVNLNFGIESGNDSMLKNMCKDTTVELSRKGIETARLAGIEPETSFMFGFFGETDTTMRDTVKFIKEENLFVPRIFFTTPFPRAPIYEESLKKGLIKDEENFLLKLGNASDFTVNLTQIPQKRLIRLRDKAVKEINRHYFKNNRAQVLCFKKNKKEEVFLSVRCTLPECGNEFVVSRPAKIKNTFYCPSCSRIYYLDLTQRIRIFGLKRLILEALQNCLYSAKRLAIELIPGYRRLRREKYWMAKREFQGYLLGSFLRSKKYG